MTSPERPRPDHWDPSQYLRFADHRLRPALELLERVPLPAPRVVYDLGCGTGDITRIIADRWPDATVFGVDNSREMLAKAAAGGGRVTWVEADIRRWQPDEQPDLVYSNAALQWVPDHPRLFPRLLAMLRPGGCLAIQVPQSWHSPALRLMRETLADGGPDGAPLLDEPRRLALGRKWVDDATEYYDLLAKRAKSLDVWETEYLQVLSGEDAVLEWVMGSSLPPILNALQEPERSIFLAEYARRLREAYPRRSDGHTLYPFRRLFIVATV